MSLDIALLRIINLHEPLPLLDSFMVFITHQGRLLLAGLSILALLKEGKKAIIPLIISLIVVGLSDATGNLLKHIFERPRPFNVIEDLRVLVGRGTSYSFPSNHALNAFAIATVLGYYFRYLRIPAFLIAGLVGLSRVYVGVHYPSDVIGGAVVGVLIGLSVVYGFNRLKEIYRDDPLSAGFYLLLFFLLIARLFYIAYGPLELSPDEAHYWEWSRRPDLSYYSKGPLIAWLILLTTSIGGAEVLAVRFFAPFFLFFTSLIIYRLSKDIYSDSRIAVLSGLLIQFVPLFSAYGVIMTIDSPFLFFWALSLYTFYRALNSEGLTWWIFLGISTGLGMLSKYSMAFFYLSGLLYLFIERREFLKRWHPYGAFLISMILFMPVIFWNINNDFVTFRHTLGHAGLYEGLRLNPRYLIDFIGSQLGVITPLLSIAIILSVIRPLLKKEGFPQEYRFLLSFSIPILGFFLIKSIQAKVQANWALMAYHTLFIYSSSWFIKNWDGLKRWLRILSVSSLFFLIFITPIIHFPQILDLPPRLDPSSRLTGWKELGVRISEISEEMRGFGPFFIVSDSYQVSSEIAFYTKGNPVVYCVNLGRRMNQYDLWPGFYDLLHYNAIFVTIKGPEEVKGFVDRFKECRREILKTHRGEGMVVREYSIYRCFDFMGMLRSPFERY